MLLTWLRLLRSVARWQVEVDAADAVSLVTDTTRLRISRAHGTAASGSVVVSAKIV